MTHEPHIRWLHERWELPHDAEIHVRGLFEAEAKGGTAFPLADQSGKWGKAALYADAEGVSPLVLVPGEGQVFLQSRRLFAAENLIARKLHALANAGNEAVDTDLLYALFSNADPFDAQRTAAGLAAGRRLAIITGGPGTGKTYTLARALALLVAQGEDIRRIKLAAPTGKAADRMKSSITASVAALPPDFPASSGDLLAVASTSTTLHRLLGCDPRSGRCRFHAGNPLPCSVLVVDECSMIDVFVWRALLEALPGDARLILVGDPFQLESIGMGRIFRELAQHAGRGKGPLSRSLVELTAPHRFKDRPAIGELAGAIRRGDGPAVLTLLQNSHNAEDSRGVTFLPADVHQLGVSHLPVSILEKLQSVASAEHPRDALALLSGVCVLTAHRHFDGGADALGARIEKYMSSLSTTRNHPVIIDRNDPATGLRNGAVGVISKAPGGERRAWFPGPDGNPREFATARLPAHSPAWAVTIHRSQGSEYDDVLVVLPRGDSPLATRELLYTAITRARKNLHIHGHPDAILRAVAADSRRTTLLATALEACERAD